MALVEYIITIPCALIEVRICRGLLDEIHVNDRQPNSPTSQNEHCDRVLRPVCTAYKEIFG